MKIKKKVKPEVVVKEEKFDKSETSGKDRRSHTRKRQTRAVEDDDDDEDPYVKDQRQKKEFVERLKQRDVDKTKKKIGIEDEY